MLQTNWEWVNQGNTDLSATKKRDFSEDNVMYIAILTSLVRLVIHIGSGAWPYINSCASQISKRSANLRRIETHQTTTGWASEPVAKLQCPWQFPLLSRLQSQGPGPLSRLTPKITRWWICKPFWMCRDLGSLVLTSVKSLKHGNISRTLNTVCVTAGGGESFKAWMLGRRAYMHESACRSNYMKVLHQTFFSKADQFTLPNWCGFFL